MPLLVQRPLSLLLVPSILVSFFSLYFQEHVTPLPIASIRVSSLKFRSSHDCIALVVCRMNLSRNVALRWAIRAYSSRVLVFSRHRGWHLHSFVSTLDLNAQPSSSSVVSFLRCSPRCLVWVEAWLMHRVWVLPRANCVHFIVVETLVHGARQWNGVYARVALQRVRRRCRGRGETLRSSRRTCRTFRRALGRGGRRTILGGSLHGAPKRETSAT